MTASAPEDITHEPYNKVPGIAKDSLVLLHNDRLAVAVDRFSCYPEGMQFRLLLRTRVYDQEVDETLRGGFRRGLELSLAYPNGKTVRTGDHNLLATTGPLLVSQGGGGGDTAWDFDFWASPLPEAGELVFSFRWSQLGLEGTASLSVAVLHRAADQAVPLWP